MTPTLLDDPMVQAGIAPFLVALLVALALGWRARAPAVESLAWLGIVAAIVTTVALSTGIAFTPLTSARRILVLVLLAPAVGWGLDRLADRGTLPTRALTSAASLAAGLAALWVFGNALAQREGAEAWLLGGGVALFVAALVLLALRLRTDGAAAGAAAFGLGLAVGVSAVLSASIGNLMNGVALAMAGAALLLLQLLRGQAVAPGYLGTLSLAVAASLFASATLVLAELRWYSLVAMLALPALAGAGLLRARALRPRVVLLGLALGAAALAVIAVAWFAARSPAT